MTTKATIACPEDSHCNLKVMVSEKGYDPKKRELTAWQEPVGFITVPSGESIGLYVYGSRRIIIEEMPR
jgi:hypothetical protein